MNTTKNSHFSEELNKLLAELPPDATQLEISLIKELMEKAHNNHPDPVFVYKLSQKLRNSQPDGVSRRNNKRFYWLGAAGIVATLVIFLFGFPFLQPTTTLNTSDNQEISSYKLTPIQSYIQPTSLPILPLLGPATVQANANLSEQFPNASWTLQTDLPTSPNSAMVYKIENVPEFSVQTARKLADKFGMKGNIFLKSSPQSDLNSYLVIDGSAQLFVDGTSQAYTFIPDLLRQGNEHGKPLPFDQLSEKATAFLKEKGLLNFPYLVEPGILRQNQILINRTLDENFPLLSTDPNRPEFLVSVASDGNILEIRGQANNFKINGNYPLRSASDAWLALLNGKIGGRFGYQVSQLVPPTPILEWSKQFRFGQQVELYGVPETLLSEDGSRTVVMMDNLVLEGNFPTFPDESQPLMKITGKMLSGNIIEVENIERSIIPSEYFGFAGILNADGANARILTIDGRNLELVDPPEGLPIREPASINGRLLPDGRVEWWNISAGSSLCTSFSTGFRYMNVGDGGGGGGGGGGYDGPGEGAGINMCEKYENLNGNITTGGFDNLQPGTTLDEVSFPQIPYESGDRIEGVIAELNGINLMKPNGTRIPQFSLTFFDQSGLPSWSANLTGENLSGMETKLHLMVRVWGTFHIENNNPIILVERWEQVDTDEKVETWQGTLEVGEVGDKIAFILKGMDGKKFILQNSLNYPPDALQVPPAIPGGIMTIEGILLKEKLEGLNVVREVMMDNGRAPGDLQPQSTLMMDILPSTSPTDLISGEVNITQARLVYLSMQFASGFLPDNHPARILQPLWEFSGTIQDGRSISLFVQAVDENYLN